MASKQSKGPCGVDGCDRPIHSKGFCYPHYFRQWRNGHTGDAAIQVKNPDANCRVDGCDATVRGGGKGMCGKHVTRFYRHGDPEVVVAFAGFVGATNPNWVGDEAGYNAVHSRLRTQRGPAREHVCGCGSPAAQWAYDHADPGQRVAPEGAYSTELSHYEPKCVPCHKRADLDRLQGQRLADGA